MNPESFSCEVLFHDKNFFLLRRKTDSFYCHSDIAKRLSSLLFCLCQSKGSPLENLLAFLWSETDQIHVVRRLETSFYPDLHLNDRRKIDATSKGNLSRFHILILCDPWLWTRGYQEWDCLVVHFDITWLTCSWRRNGRIPSTLMNFTWVETGIWKEGKKDRGSEDDKRDSEVIAWPSLACCPRKDLVFREDKITLIIKHFKCDKESSGNRVGGNKEKVRTESSSSASSSLETWSLLLSPETDERDEV